MVKKKKYENKIITIEEGKILMRCPGCDHLNVLSEMIWKKGIAFCKGKGCLWRFKITWGKKEKDRILKTKPKGDKGFHPTKYGIPQGKDEKGHWKPWKTRNLKIGDIYDIVTEEPGEDIKVKAKFLGWKKEIIIRDDGKTLPDNIYYKAIFSAVGNIEIETDYILTITKSED